MVIFKTLLARKKVQSPYLLLNKKIVNKEISSKLSSTQTLVKPPYFWWFFSALLFINFAKFKFLNFSLNFYVRFCCKFNNDLPLYL